MDGGMFGMSSHLGRVYTLDFSEPDKAEKGGKDTKMKGHANTETTEAREEFSPYINVNAPSVLAETHQRTIQAWAEMGDGIKNHSPRLGDMLHFTEESIRRNDEFLREYFTD
jgi:hypothetical protein